MSKRNNNINGMASCRFCRTTLSAKNLARHLKRCPMRGRATPRNKVPKGGRRQIATVNTGYAPNQVMKRQVENTPGFEGLTADGRKFVLANVHPNDDTRGGSIMMPDLAETARVPMELRDYQVLRSPYAGVEPFVNSNWDCMIAVLPHSDVALAYRTRPSSQEEWTDWHAVALDGALSPGSIKIGHAESSWVNNSAPEIRKNHTGFRQIYKGVTIEHNRPTLYDQGIVTAGQMVVQAGEVSRIPPYVTLPPDTDVEDLQTVPAYVHEGIPFDDGDIIRWCPNATQWEAKHGIYMPMRFRDPENFFRMDESLVYNENAAGEVQEQSVGGLIVLRNLGDVTTNPVGRGLVYSDQQGQFCPTTGALANQTLGIIMFTGISNFSQLVIKTRVGVEVIPKANNDLHTQIRTPDTPDETAVKLASAVASKLPVAFPHKYNSLGALLPLLGKVLPAVLPTVMPWLSKTIGRGAGWLSGKLFPSTAPKGQIQEPELD